MKTLENSCRKMLKIGENITHRKIIEFISEYGFHHLFLVNFLSGFPDSLVSTEVLKLFRIEILAFVEKGGIYGKYRIIYCQDDRGNFDKYYANTKINQYLNDFLCKKTKDGLCIPKKRIAFFPRRTMQIQNIRYLKVYI